MLGIGLDNLFPLDNSRFCFLSCDFLGLMMYRGFFVIDRASDNAAQDEGY